MWDVEVVVLLCDAELDVEVGELPIAMREVWIDVAIGVATVPVDIGTRLIDIVDVVLLLAPLTELGTVTLEVKRKA